MIYTHGNTGTFPELSKSLSSYGISEEVISLAREYLDTEKDRDNSILDRIPSYAIVNSDWTKRSAFDNAVKKEITKRDDNELTERFILLAHTLFGVNSYSFMSSLYYFGSGTKEFEKTAVRVFSSRYEGKGEECFYALFINNALSQNSGVSTNRIKPPKFCMDTLEFAGDSVKLKIYLCCLALDGIQIPEKQNIISKLFRKSDSSPIVDKAVETLKKLLNDGVHATDMLMLCGLAEAAYFSDEMKNIFSGNIVHHAKFAADTAIRLPIHQDRIFDMIADNKDAVTKNYIELLAGLVCMDNRKYSITDALKRIAREYPEIFVSVLKSSDNAETANKMEKIIAQENPSYKPDSSELKESFRNKTALLIAEEFTAKYEICSYLLGKSSFSDIIPFLEKEQVNSYAFAGKNITYIFAYGIDDFAERCIIITAISCQSWVMYGYMGVNFRNRCSDFVNIFLKNDIPAEYALKVCAGFFLGTSSMRKAADDLAKYGEKLREINTDKLDVDGRKFYIYVLDSAGAKNYRNEILAMADDKSKAVKNTLAEILTKQRYWINDVKELLADKKAGKREIAVSVIEKQGAKGYTEVLETAFEAEKSEKLRIRIAALLNKEIEAPEKEKSSADLITELTKGNKTRKIAWLFETPFRPVRLADGEYADENIIKALILCYAGMENGKLPDMAVQIAEKLRADDVEYIANEVFARWIESGAAAKNKWVLYLAAVHGGNEAISTLMKYIKDWSEHSRGAIAADAVRAMAMNGSSFALVNVDSMARKFRKRQVRDAAEKAMQDAAKELGITAEELADRIVPDLGFDDKMCRVFDYGNRKFSVYLTPSLETEIYNGEKRVKNLPKPAASDNSETAEKSYKEFKDMKKQLKTVISAQKARLEYVLMCDRKWTAENWENLFVKNPVMHCFAIGLIWGIYQNGKLETSFRYMDDGSFTTSDEEEFEIPENAEIGLVHPIELTEEEKNIWTEQLEDYEITQPFLQLSRPVCRMTREERNKTVVKRFYGTDTSGQTLAGRMLKAGWYKGAAQDGGAFFEFEREDISSVTKDSKGILTSEGFFTELKFSGMYIASFEFDDEEVMIEELVFHKAGDCRNPLQIWQVNERYFSEIIMQLTAIIGTSK